MRRDIAERGRTPEGVKVQWERQVQPMHERFVEPSKAHATWIAGDDASLRQALESVKRRAGL
jgi:uridine kinase